MADGRAQLAVLEWPSAMRPALSPARRGAQQKLHFCQRGSSHGSFANALVERTNAARRAHRETKLAQKPRFCQRERSSHGGISGRERLRGAFQTGEVVSPPARWKALPSRLPQTPRFPRVSPLSLSPPLAFVRWTLSVERWAAACSCFCSALSLLPRYSLPRYPRLPRAPAFHN